MTNVKYRLPREEWGRFTAGWTSPAGMTVDLVFHSTLANCLWANPRPGANFAITLPTRTGVVVHIARGYIEGDHLAHEVAGHGYQRMRMGFVAYSATYGWHFVLRRGSWADHMMEQEADRIEAEVRHTWPLVSEDVPRGPLVVVRWSQGFMRMTRVA